MSPKRRVVLGGCLSLSLSLSNFASGALIDPSRADLDGDGSARPEEAITLEQFLDLAVTSGRGAAYIVEIVRAYLAAESKGIVDLSRLFTVPSAAGGAVLLGSTSCDGCPNPGDNRFTRGDADCNGQLNITDSIYILNYLFHGGPPPRRFDAADVNDNGALTIDDAIALNNYLFLGGPKPPKPLEYPGLDPTPDAFEGPCDLVPTRFQEFNVFSGERDVDGNGSADALYIVPGTRRIQLERPGDPAEILFYQFPEGTNPRLLAVSGNRVVYVLVDGTIPPGRTVYALRDEDGNGTAWGQGDTVRTFLLPSRPIDAVLADAKTDPEDVAGQLITLHTGPGAPTWELLVLSTDSSAPFDGIIDDGAQVQISDRMLLDPLALAVDSGSARVFVCGTLRSDTSRTAVVFYEDTNGDKLVDAAYADPFLKDLKPSENYASIVFIPQNQNNIEEPQDLLVLSHRELSSAILCARDVGQYYYAPTSRTVFRASILLGGKILDGLKTAEGKVIAQLTREDDWTVCEYEDLNQDCVADVAGGCFASADSALAEAVLKGAGGVRLMCRVQLAENVAYEVTQRLCWVSVDNFCGALSVPSTTRMLCASSIPYQCRNVCSPALAEAKWPGADPPIEARADWVGVPGTQQTAWLWVDGVTQWEVGKDGTCCLSTCYVRTVFRVQSWIYTDIHNQATCPGKQFRIANVTTDSICTNARISGVENTALRRCATERLLPVTFRISARNQVRATRERNCNETRTDGEYATLRTLIRPKCSLVRPY